MYTNCLFCPAPLGNNRALEYMPVGRRLAFDLERGRLWAVCPRCGRWNLCPFDERWEALEECARLSDASFLQEATDSISLLKHRSGLSLVRVGKPSLAELVSWRYARNLLVRRRGFLLGAAAAGAVSATGLFGVVLGGGGAFSLLSSWGSFKVVWDLHRPVIDMTTEEGRRLRITAPAARGVRFSPDQTGGPVLRVGTKDTGDEEISGSDVTRLLARAMPYINETGGKTDAAILAGRTIAESGGAEGFLASIARDQVLHRRAILGRGSSTRQRVGAIYRFPSALRLGLEAASHLSQEERVLSGELRGIIEEWKTAEELAEISDNLLTPPGWPSFKEKHRSKEATGDAV